MGDQTNILETYVSPVGLAIAFLLVAIVLIIWNTIISVKLSRLRQSYKTLMNGAGVDNLEQVISNMHHRIASMETIADAQGRTLKEQGRILQMQKGHVGIIRYNAFGERGSDMSFSVAILNEERDGVVLTGIHNREATYMYAKPLEGGHSRYALTPEEKEAMDRCFEREHALAGK